MELEIPYSWNDEDATIFVTNYDGQTFDYELVQNGYVIQLNKKQDLEVYAFVEKYIANKEISYAEYLDDMQYDFESEVDR